VSSNNVKVDVSIEKVINKAIADALQSIADKEGILVHQVSVSWADASSVEESKSLITEVSLSTSMRI